HQHRYEFAQGRGRGYVSISYRGNGHHGPVYAVGNALKPRASVLDDVHHRTNNDHHQDQEQHEQHNLPVAAVQGLHNKGTGLHEPPQLEDPEHPQQAQAAQHDEILISREKYAQVTGKNSQQVDDAYHTQDVFPFLLQDQDAQGVFDG